jgi:hypothetical protein
MSVRFADTFLFLAAMSPRDASITETLTGDHHFTQAGFVAVLA